MKFLIFVLLMTQVFNIASKNVMVVDAGSSGSRVYVWKVSEDNLENP